MEVRSLVAGCGVELGEMGVARKVDGDTLSVVWEKFGRVDWWPCNWVELVD